jgi:hypothetical protein
VAFLVAKDVPFIKNISRLEVFKHEQLFIEAMPEKLRNASP